MVAVETAVEDLEDDVVVVVVAVETAVEAYAVAVVAAEPVAGVAESLLGAVVLPVERLC